MLLGFAMVAMQFGYMHFEIVMLKTFPPGISGACAMKEYHKSASSQVPSYLKSSLKEFWESDVAPSCVLKEVKPAATPKQQPASFAAVCKNMAMSVYNYVFAIDDDAADEETMEQTVNSTWIFEDGGVNDNSAQAYIDFAWNSASLKCESHTLCNTAVNAFEIFKGVGVAVGQYAQELTLDGIFDSCSMVGSHVWSTVSETCSGLHYQAVTIIYPIIDCLLWTMALILNIAAYFLEILQGIIAIYLHNWELSAVCLALIIGGIVTKIGELRDTEDRIKLVRAEFEEVEKKVANNHYVTLGEAENATHRQLQLAYWREARLHHADRGGDHDRMAEVNAAWEKLQDGPQRDQYNDELNSWCQDCGRLDQELNSLQEKLNKSIVFFLLKQLRQ